MQLARADNKFGVSKATEVEVVREDMMWGVKLGLFFAFFYMIVAVALYLTSGPQRFHAHGVGLTEVVFLYLGGGVVAGAVVGILRRFIRGRASAMVVGVVATIPIVFGASFLISGPIAQWTADEWIALPISAVVLGAGGGSLLWSMRDL
jgi:hypothetical protein